MENKLYDIDPFNEEEWEYEDEIDEDIFDSSITDNPYGAQNYPVGITGVSGTSGQSNERIEEYFFGRIRTKLVKNRIEKPIKYNIKTKRKFLNTCRKRF